MRRACLRFDRKDIASGSVKTVSVKSTTGGETGSGSIFMTRYDVEHGPVGNEQ